MTTKKFETQAEFRARLARDAGITPAPTSRRVGSWIKVHTGDRVYDVADPRHVGRVEAVLNGGTVVVKWPTAGRRHSRFAISKKPMEQNNETLRALSRESGGEH
jgi:hypothetical protein